MSILTSGYGCLGRLEILVSTLANHAILNASPVGVTYAMFQQL